MREDVSTLLKENASLMINVRIDEYSPGVLTNSLYPNIGLPNGPNPGYVEVFLREPLLLWHRGTKSSALCPCKCFIPALEMEATSLNHAYTLISKKYETKRQANTGNVFRKAYYRDEHGHWQMLERLREEFDREFAKDDSAGKKKETEQLKLIDVAETQTEQPVQAERQKSEEVVLRNRVWDDGNEFSRLTAYVDEKGALVMQGYDAGAGVEEAWGRDDYDFSRTVSSEHVPTVLLQLIKDRFTSSSDFHNWLEDKEIPSKFNSWP
jgi:hypothetical protein